LTGKQTIVAYHSGEIIRPKTFKRILEGAGLTIDEFVMGGVFCYLSNISRGKEAVYLRKGASGMHPSDVSLGK
jgi:hypothetical protein